MILNSPTISGSLTVTGNIITSGSITISGSIASASYASNADLLDGLDSTAFATTGAYSATSASLYATSASLSATSGSLSTASGSFNSRVTALEVTGSALTSSLLTVSGSGYATSGSLSTASGSFNSRVATIESKYATTGSNTFIGTQVVSGSILQSGSFTTTGTIIAQTINVQTVTSSVVYSSGSNVFGNDIGNSQRFTGSVLITGSLTIAGASSATSYSGTTIYGSTVACSPVGCFATSCATSFIGGTMSGTTIYGSTAVCSANGLLIGNGGVTATCNYLPKFTGTSTIGNSILQDDGTNVSIGYTTNPSLYKLDVNGTGRFQGDALYVYSTGSIEIGRDTTYSTPYMAIGFGGRADANNKIYAARDTSAGIFINATTGRGITMLVNGGATTALSIASTGAATFSSSVTATGGLISNGGSIGYGGGELGFGGGVSSSAGIYTSATGSPTIYFDHRGTSNTGLFIFRNGTGGGNTLLTLASTGAATFSSSVTSSGLIINGVSNAATILTNSNTNVIAIVANTSYVDNVPRIELNGTSQSPVPNSNYYRANTQVFTASSASTEYMRLSSGGMTIGGGTTTTSKLTILATTGVATPGSPTLGIYDASAPTYGFDFSLEGVATGDLYLNRLVSGTRTPVLQLARATGAATFSSSVNNDWGAIFNNTSTTNPQGLYVKTGGTSAYAAFRVNANTTTYFSVEGNGNVGIGTTSPSAPLQLGDGSVNSYMKIRAADGGSVVFTKGSTDAAFVGETQAALGSGNGLMLYTYSGADRPILFYTAGTERMRITSTGQLQHKESSGTLAYQRVVGKKASAGSGTAVTIAYVGHTHSITVRAYVRLNDSSSGMITQVFSTTYGASSAGTATYSSYNQVTGISLAYNNGAGYLIQVTPSYTTGTPDIYFVIEGISIDTMYVP